MAPNLILITGANGHLGYRVVVSALQAGHNVRAVVRRQETADQVKAAALIKPFLSSLEVVLVEDLLKEGAFDNTVVGVDAIIHVASPLSKPTAQYFEDIIQPAIQMTMGILRSAAKSSSVKRVVITSSVVVLDIGWGRVLGATDLGPIPDPHGSCNSPFEAYVASKRLARAECMKFVKQEKPGFDVINILPSVVLGRNELTTSTASMASAGTNRYIVNIVNGMPQTARFLTGSVHVNDCADIHVRALDLAIKGDQDFLAHANRVDWSDGSVSAIARKYFPEEVETGMLKLGGETSNLEVDLDATKTEQEFGIKWIGFEEQVKSVVGHYLELKKAEV